MFCCLEPQFSQVFSIFQKKIKKSIFFCRLTIWGNKVIRERPEVGRTAIPLLQAGLQMLLLNKLTTDNVFIEMDFLHQESAFKEFIVGYRLRVSELIRRMALCAPSDFLEFSFNALQSLMDSKEGNEDKWTAVQMITDNTAKSVPAPVKAQYRLVAFQLIDRLMAFEAGTPVQTNPQLKSYALSCISRIAHSFIPNPPPEQQAVSLEILGRIIKYDMMLLTSTLNPGMFFQHLLPGCWLIKLCARSKIIRSIEQINRL